MVWEAEKPIRVAIAGVGNCCSAFIQGLAYYRTFGADGPGLMNVEIGGYQVTDIVPVAAFDVDARKVGLDLSQAIFSDPNIAYRYPDVEVPSCGVTVQMGPAMDGVSPDLTEFVTLADRQAVDVTQVLRDSGADMLLNFLPTGSARAARCYADAAIKEARIGFINGMPELIVCDPVYQQTAIEHGVPLIGDDVKSQLGGTAIHRALLQLLRARGIHVTRTYQLNYAGNTDFYNLIHRGQSKHKTKREALEMLIPPDADISTGFSYIDLMGDRKTAIFYIDGSNYGNAPLHFEAKLEVEDSSNFGGVMVEMIRYMKLGLDRGVAGVLQSASAVLTKHPPMPVDDDAVAIQHLKEFTAGQRER
ncbi:MAG: myo-inositol-1-phosphate synthase [Candidatus Latescibacteria bacterium]|nr:myo-inositol-1-phosphate synthase [Candidatus Latescibacterota bacterium]